MTESAYFEIMWFMLLVSWCSDGSMPGATLHVSLLERTGTQASWLPAACFSHHTLGPYIWNLPEFRKRDGKCFFSPMGSFGKWFRWNGLTGDIQLQGGTLGSTRKAGWRRNHRVGEQRVYWDLSCLSSNPHSIVVWFADLGEVPES